MKKYLKKFYINHIYNKESITIKLIKNYNHLEENINNNISKKSKSP